MKLSLFNLLFLIVLSSCSQKKTFPEKISNKLSLSELQMEINTPIEQHLTPTDNESLMTLSTNVDLYKKKNINFNLSKLKSSWENIISENKFSNWSEIDSLYWIETTGLLLELSGQTKYAEVLENIYLTASTKIQKEIVPYIITKQIDNIYVNLFQALEIVYPHSLGGNVSFKQETNYPESGSIKLHFGMTERQYMELYIRIPHWAKGTTVTVKHVKYLATPGTYCKIAKKWKEGDLVEIEFPMEQMPQ